MLDLTEPAPVEVAVEAQAAPAEAEAAAIRADYQVAMKGLRSFVSMGLRLVDVKARLPHGKYLSWCEEFLPELSKPHLHRAKTIAEGLCEMSGVKCLSRETFENLPTAMVEIIDGASGYRALLGMVHEFRHDEAEEAAKAKCYEEFAKDSSLRDEWEPRVLSGELSWCQAVRGLFGQINTLGKHRADPNYTTLMPKVVTTLKNGFSQWDRLPEEAQQKTISAFRELMTELPASVRSALGLVR